jgi:hypothetical protein
MPAVSAPARVPVLIRALVLSCLLPSIGTAAPTSVPVGDTHVVLDAPSGYSDTTYLGSPRLQDLAESLTPASNRVLLFAISDDDLRKFTLGDPPDLRRYMVAVTPKSREREYISAARFRGMADDLRRGVTLPEAGADTLKLLEKQPIGKPAALAELRSDGSAVSYLQGTRLQPTKIPGLFGGDERQNYMLSTTTLVHLRGRAIDLAVFTLFNSPEDAAWVRAVTLRWIEDLQRLNR